MGCAIGDLSWFFSLSILHGWFFSDPSERRNWQALLDSAIEWLKRLSIWPFLKIIKWEIIRHPILRFIQTFTFWFLLSGGMASWGSILHFSFYLTTKLAFTPVPRTGALGILLLPSFWGGHLPNATYSLTGEQQMKGYAILFPDVSLCKYDANVNPVSRP